MPRFGLPIRKPELDALTPETLPAFRPLHDRVLIRRRPPRTMRGVLHIPEKYQDHPLDGIVVAVGPGLWCDPHACTQTAADGLCGGRATHVRYEGEDTHYYCTEHVASYGGGDLRRLLVRQPPGVEIGDRVAFTPYADGHHTREIGGETYVLTGAGDLLAVLGPDVGVVERP